MKNKKFKHTPLSAAKAIRGLLEKDIAKNWDEYFDGEHKANAYTATLLVMEQCNGPAKRTPVSFRRASQAVAKVMPELFAEYWEALERAKK